MRRTPKVTFKLPPRAVGLALLTLALGGCGFTVTRRAASVPGAPPSVLLPARPVPPVEKHLTLACPVCRRKADLPDMIPVLAEKQVRYVCDVDCALRLKEHPEKYASGLRSQAALLQAHPRADVGGQETAFCPVCKQEILRVDTTPVKLKGKTYFACCAQCVTALKDKPDQYIKRPDAGAPVAPAKPQHLGGMRHLPHSMAGILWASLARPEDPAR